jgi:hypothetical protein
MRAGGTTCEQDSPRRNQPMSVQAIYPRLAMMPTMVMPAMKRSDLIMALVPLRLPSPMVPKKTDGSLCGFLKIADRTRRPGTYFLIPPFPSGPARPGGSPLGAGEWNFCDLLAISTTYETRLPRGDQDESALPARDAGRAVARPELRPPRWRDPYADW